MIEKAIFLSSVLAVICFFISTTLAYREKFYFLKDVYPEKLISYTSFSGTIISTTFFFDMFKKFDLGNVFHYYFPLYIDSNRFKTSSSIHRKSLLRIVLIQYITMLHIFFSLIILNIFYW